MKINIQQSAFCVVLVSIAILFSCKSNESYTIRFGATELYNSGLAKQERLSEQKDAVILEERNFKPSFQGSIESDLLDILDINHSAVTEKKVLKSIKISTEATIPEEAKVDLYYSFGETIYSAVGWTDWEKAVDINASIKAVGSYFRFRLVLSAPDIEKSPEIRSVSIDAVYDNINPSFTKKITVQQFENEKLINSQYSFGYERKDNKDLAAFVKLMGYDTLVSENMSDIEKLIVLNTAVAKTPNHDHSGFTTNYPFDPREICSMQNGKMSIKGHCMSYAAVLINTLTSLGFHSRHWAANGFRDMDHEVVEVWVDSLRKWIYLDPSLSQYYLDPVTKTPLSLKEMHDIFIKFALEPGELLSDLSLDSLKIRIEAKGKERGKLAPIICVDKGWHYGIKTDPETYDWGWFHGYMISGYLRLTDRNNFISEKEPWFSHFGEGINFNTYLHWVDDATPPRTEAIQTFTGRERDLWWSLNQAAIKATRTDENIISLEFGNTQPFFKQYTVIVDNNSPVAVLNGSFIWKLNPGENKIKVFPEDSFGKIGIPSFLNLSVN
jgi:hypothetical protein